MKHKTGKYEVLFYETSSGDCPVEKMLQSLPTKIRGKVTKWIEKLEELGPDLPRPYADKVQDKIRELRIRFGSTHYRFLYFFLDKKIIITHGFIKKTNRISESEIGRAERYMADFKERYKKGGIKL